MNKFVDFINQFYSQNASQSAGYAELTDKKLEGISLKISKLNDDVADGKVDIVILTGNAGDGKTYLCKEIYSRLTGESLPNKGIHRFNLVDGDLCVVKDASEVPLSELNMVLGEIESRLTVKGKKKRDIYILAGNEGKLTDVFFKNFTRLQELLGNALRTVYKDERESTGSGDGALSRVKVINFNWRALTEENAFKSILKAFVNRKDWEPACDRCQYADRCPIYFNAQAVRSEDTQERIKTLFKFFRYMEGHFTLRELFSTIAFILTGGLNCLQIQEEIKNSRQLNYVFYNNIFSRHNIGREEGTSPQDRILRELKKYDVAFAPLTDENKRVIKYANQLKKRDIPGKKNNAKDLQWFEELSKEFSSKKLPVYDAMKRRRFFLISKYFWEDIFSLIGSTDREIDIVDFLPFSGCKEFDDFISGKFREGDPKYDNFKTTIVKGLNLLANRKDAEAELWLKVYKPYESDQPISLELTGDRVETLKTYLSIKVPYQDTEYLETMPVELSLSIRSDEKDKNPIRLPINLELYEGLRSAAMGNQSKQHFGSRERFIHDFREALFYRFLKSGGRQKFHINTPEIKKRPIELINEENRLILRG